MSIEQICPLCGTPAAYEIYNKPHCKHFMCSVCTEFYIDTVAE